MMNGGNRRSDIITAVENLVADFVYYDRKEDEDLPRGSIQGAIDAGEISVDEIVARFAASLREGLGGR